MDDFLVKITGNITVNPLKSPGDSVQKGELVAEIDRDGKRLNIFSPLSGEIINANYRISDTPGLLNNDPYGSGWMYDIKPASWKAETNNSYLAEDATAWFNAELRHLKDFLSVSTGKYSRDQTLVFQEGGELQINPLADLQPEIWDDFQKEFLNITG
ncbi:MAG: hypothetical protein HQ541_22710 [Mariniphaga sp.]|nr:hypothetical protein [Mariniphaga sp.]